MQYKYIFTLLFLFISIGLFAQENDTQLYPGKIKQRSILVGGDLNASYRNYSTYDNLNRNVKLTGSLFEVNSNLKGGYFVLNDFCIGGKIGLHHANYDMDSSAIDYRETYLLFGPFVRYYLHNGIFGEASIAGGLFNIARGDKHDLVEAMGGIGYAIFLNRKVSVEPMISFRYFKQNLSDTQGSFDTRDYGPYFSVGFQIYLYKDNIVKMK